MPAVSSGWAEGMYTYEDVHPPLARIAMALGPYLHGIGSTTAILSKAPIDGGNVAFAYNGEYLNNLARAG